MSARLEHKLDKQKSVTEMIIDSADGKKCICILRLEQYLDVKSYRDYIALQFEMNSLVKAINSGVVKVVGQSEEEV